jgi:hypothetical protein
MNAANLIPISQRTPEERAAMGRKGGLMKKGKVIFGKTKCKNCKLPCPLKDKGTNENLTCKIPDVQRKVLEIAIDPSNLDAVIIETLFDLRMMAKTPRDKKMMLDALTEIKKIITPQELNVNQKSVVINIEGINLEDDVQANK